MFWWSGHRFWFTLRRVQHTGMGRRQWEYCHSCKLQSQPVPQRTESPSSHGKAQGSLQCCSQQRQGWASPSRSKALQQPLLTLPNVRATLKWPNLRRVTFHYRTLQFFTEGYSGALQCFLFLLLPSWGVRDAQPEQHLWLPWLWAFCTHSRPQLRSALGRAPLAVLPYSRQHFSSA